MGYLIGTKTDSFFSDISRQCTWDHKAQGNARLLRKLGAWNILDGYLEVASDHHRIVKTFRRIKQTLLYSLPKL